MTDEVIDAICSGSRLVPLSIQSICSFAAGKICYIVAEFPPVIGTSGLSLPFCKEQLF